MAQATYDPIIAGPVRLSSLLRDPFVRAAFLRAERDDQGAAFAVPAPSPSPLAGGATEPLPALFRAMVCLRTAVLIDLGAARLAAHPSDYLKVHPRLGRAIVRHAIEDVRGVLAGRLLNSGMTDGEAMTEARLYAEIQAQPVTMRGNLRANHLRVEADRIRRRGIGRVRERGAARVDPAMLPVLAVLQ